MINLFISDLHLEESRPDIADIFLRFLQENTKNDRTLYILGDFFEAWIGDDDLSPFHLMIMDAMRKATRDGLPIYLMHGNRDFLLGKSFLRMTGCKLLPDEWVVTIAGIPTLLMHGDTLCSEDVAYLKFRKKTRMWIFQKLFLWKSLAKRKKIAENMRENSRKYTSTAAEKIMDVTQETVLDVMKKHKVQHLIHGHTHRPAVHKFEIDSKPATRTVLAAWHDEGSVLVCEDATQKVITLPLK